VIATATDSELSKRITLVLSLPKTDRALPNHFQISRYLPLGFGLEHGELKPKDRESWPQRQLVNSMKQIYNGVSLVFLLLVIGFTHSDTQAQIQPVFLRLKGVGIGSPVSGGGTGVKVGGDFAYVVHPGGLEIYSITNPSAPVRVGGRETQSPANAVELVGRYAYLALGATQTLTNDAGAFEIVDVGDPFNPVRVAYTNTLARANDIRVAGDYAYVAECTRWTGSNLTGALEIFDVSTPTNPLRVASFDTLGCAASVDVSANYAYLADGVTDLQVLDVTDAAHPRRVGVYQPDLSHCAFEPLGPPNNYVQTVGQFAYSAGGNGLNVLDLNDPSQPVRISHNSCVPIYSLHVAGQYAFRTEWRSFLNTFLLLVADITNPTNLVTVGLKADWQPAPMQVVSNLIYVARNPLTVYELTDRPIIHSISSQDGNLTLVWEYAPGFVLERTTSLTNPVWSVVPDSANQTFIELPAAAGAGFFRLARP